MTELTCSKPNHPWSRDGSANLRDNEFFNDLHHCTQSFVTYQEDLMEFPTTMNQPTAAGRIAETHELLNCLIAGFPLSPVSTPTRSRPNLLTSQRTLPKIMIMSHTTCGTRSSSSRTNTQYRLAPRVTALLPLTLIRVTGHTISTFPTIGPAPTYGFCSA